MNNEAGSNNVKGSGTKSLKDIVMKVLGFILDNLFKNKCTIDEVPDFKEMSINEVCDYLQSHKQTPEICLAAVQHSGLPVKYVKEQTPEICMAAVKENGLALQYIKEQTPEICIVAVKQNPYALAYVKEQTLEICVAAVKKDDLALEYVEERILQSAKFQNQLNML